MKDCLIIILVLILGSCSYHGGLMMSNADFDEDTEIVNLAYGEARTVHVLGIGGLSTRTLIRDAKLDMYSAYPLKKGQAYSNLFVDFNSRFFLFWVVTYATVSADVVNLNEGAEENELQELFESSTLGSLGKLSREDPRFWTRNEDSLLYFFKYGEPDTVAVLSVLSDNKIAIETSDSILRQENPRNLFLYNQNFSFEEQNFELGDTVMTTTKTMKNSPVTVKKPGVVIGVNPKSSIVWLIQERSYETFDYKEIE